MLVPKEKIKNLRKEEYFTPISLYRLTAKIIKTGLFKVEDIFQYLSPSLESLKVNFSKNMELAFKLF